VVEHVVRRRVRRVAVYRQPVEPSVQQTARASR
jgi:hypothetical protein